MKYLLILLATITVNAQINIDSLYLTYGVESPFFCERGSELVSYEVLGFDADSVRFVRGFADIDDSVNFSSDSNYLTIEADAFILTDVDSYVIRFGQNCTGGCNNKCYAFTDWYSGEVIINNYELVITKATDSIEWVNDVPFAYKITVENVGDSDITNVQIIDIGLEDCLVTSDPLTYAIDTLKASESLDLLIEVTPTDCIELTDLKNTVLVESDNTPLDSASTSIPNAPCAGCAQVLYGDNNTNTGFTGLTIDVLGDASDIRGSTYQFVNETMVWYVKELVICDDTCEVLLEIPVGEFGKIEWYNNVSNVLSNYGIDVVVGTSPYSLTETGNFAKYWTVVTQCGCPSFSMSLESENGTHVKYNFDSEDFMVCEEPIYNLADATPDCMPLPNCVCCDYYFQFGIDSDIDTYDILALDGSTIIANAFNSDLIAYLESIGFVNEFDNKWIGCVAEEDLFYLTDEAIPGGLIDYQTSGYKGFMSAGNVRTYLTYQYCCDDETCIPPDNVEQSIRVFEITTGQGGGTLCVISPYDIDIMATEAALQAEFGASTTLTSTPFALGCALTDTKYSITGVTGATGQTPLISITYNEGECTALVTPSLLLVIGSPINSTSSSVNNCGISSVIGEPASETNLGATGFDLANCTNGVRVYYDTGGYVDYTIAYITQPAIGSLMITGTSYIDTECNTSSNGVTTGDISGLQVSIDCY